jgi:hypothetical protein
MRMLVKAVFDTDAASEVIASGQGAEVNRRIADRFQPEAFYAFAEDGQRTVLMVFDLTDPSQIPVLTEPMYQQGKAKVTLTPIISGHRLPSPPWKPSDWRACGHCRLP